MYLGQAFDREELRVRVVMVRLALGDDGGGSGDVRAVVRIAGARRGHGFHLPVRVSNAYHLVAHPALRTAEREGRLYRDQHSQHRPHNIHDNKHVRHHMHTTVPMVHSCPCRRRYKNEMEREMLPIAPP